LVKFISLFLFVEVPSVVYFTKKDFTTQNRI